MKKMVIVMFVFMLVFMATAMAEFFDLERGIYGIWKDENRIEYERFFINDLSIEGEAELYDHIVYLISDNSHLASEYTGSLKTVEQKIESTYTEIFGEDINIKVKIKVIGKRHGLDILYVSINTDKDMRTLDEGFGNAFDEPVYGLRAICYDHY